MNITRKKQVRGEKTKKNILNTALNLFSEKGYNNVTVDDIVRESGTSKGSFYLHFKSKDKIFLEKFKEIDDYYIYFLETLSSDFSASKKLLLFVDGQARFLEDELGKEILRVLYSSFLIPNEIPYFIDENRPLYQILKSFVREGQANLEFDPKLTVDEVTLLIARSIIGSIYYWCLRTDDYNLPSETVKLVSAVLKGISATK